VTEMDEVLKLKERLIVLLEASVATAAVKTSDKGQKVWEDWGEDDDAGETKELERDAISAVISRNIRDEKGPG
jgi:hypothetical protein